VGISHAETPEEQVLGACLLEIFKGRQLNFEETFSEAGGDSLGAIQLITLLIEKHFTVQIADIINPEYTLRDIARLLVPHVSLITKKPVGVWEKPVEWTDEQFERVVAQYGRENIERIYDLTLVQNLLLNFCIAHPEVSPFHIQEAYRLKGTLDVELCCDAFAVLEKKYPILKTAIASIKDHPKQFILSNRGLEITIVMNEALDKVIERDFKRGFDLEYDNLIRIVLIKEHTRYTHLIINIHHILTDGWTNGMLMRDLAKTYRKLVEGTSLSILMDEAENWSKTIPSYEDFVNYSQNLNQEAALAYFVKKFDGYTAQPKIAPDYDGSKYVEGNPIVAELVGIPQIIVEGIHALAKRYQITSAAIYEGVFAFLLSYECGSSDLMYGKLSLGRGLSFEGIADIAGTFFTTIPTRITFRTDNTFAELFKLVNQQINNDMKYDFVDFVKLQERLGQIDLLSLPYFNYYQSYHDFTWTDDLSLHLEKNITIESTEFYLNIEPILGSNLIRMRFAYNQNLYALDRIKRFLNTYLSVLEYVITHAKAKLCETPVNKGSQ
jgi:hypothetical protein